MAYILKRVGKATNVPYHYFECDNESDLSVIKVTGIPMGSRCYVINSGKTYALNSLKEWKLVPIGSLSGGSGDSGGSGGGGGSGGDVIYDGGEET